MTMMVVVAVLGNVVAGRTAAVAVPVQYWAYVVDPVAHTPRPIVENTDRMMMSPVVVALDLESVAELYTGAMHQQD